MNQGTVVGRRDHHFMYGTRITPQSSTLPANVCASQATQSEPRACLPVRSVEEQQMPELLLTIVTVLYHAVLVVGVAYSHMQSSPPTPTPADTQRYHPDLWPNSLLSLTAAGKVSTGR